MIQMLSRLEVADNTGARRVRMIRRLGQLTDTAGVGDIIICSVKDSTPDAQVKKGSVCRAVIASICSSGHRPGTRASQPVPRYVRWNTNPSISSTSAAQGPCLGDVSCTVSQPRRRCCRRIASVRKV